jgi:hypothetical protein
MEKAEQANTDGTPDDALAEAPKKAHRKPARIAPAASRESAIT